jgi:hypothetical protein
MLPAAKASYSLADATCKPNENAEEHSQLEDWKESGRPLHEFTEAFARRPEPNQGKPVAVKFMASMEEGPAVRAGPR